MPRTTQKLIITEGDVALIRTTICKEILSDLLPLLKEISDKLESLQRPTRDSTKSKRAKRAPRCFCCGSVTHKVRKCPDTLKSRK